MTLDIEASSPVVVIDEPTIAAAPPQPPAPPATPPSPQPRLRLLPPCIEDEPAWKRWTYLALALIVTGAFWYFTMSFFAPGPGRPGIDENAYLVGGKNIAQRFSPGMHPSNPYTYVGAMWVMARKPAQPNDVFPVNSYYERPFGIPLHRMADVLQTLANNPKAPQATMPWYYPKYPFGVPLLNAIAIWTGGKEGAFHAFYVSPICATLAVLAIFFLTRQIAGSFMALLAMILLATNPTMLQLAPIPSSHAPAIGFSLCGMLFLVWWWRSGNIVLGILAGFLLGYTVTIRYSEGLLLLPLLVACISSVRWKQWRSYVRVAMPLIAWGVPAGTLAIFNYVTTGHLTGYDASNESTGFTMTQFLGKWEFSVSQLLTLGLFVILPLGLAGMLLLTQKSWRLGLIMTLWFVPGVLVYMAYYWGEQSPGLGFLRFFLTLFPPAIVSAMWLLGAASRWAFAAVNAKPDSPCTTHRVWWISLACAASGIVVAAPVYYYAGPLWGVVGGAVALLAGFLLADPIPVGAGILVAGAAAVGVAGALPEMDRQHLNNQNLAYSARQMLAAIPAPPRGSKDKPVVFCDAGMFPQTLSYLQFIGDYEWYSVDAFTPKPGGGLGFLGMRRGGGGNNEQDSNPVLVSDERVDFLRSCYNGKLQSEMSAMQNQLMRNALDQGRAVYAIVTYSQLNDFYKNYITKEFQYRRIAQWSEVANLPQDRDSETPGSSNGDRRSRPRFGDFRNDHPLMQPRMRGWIFDSPPQWLQVIQITRKPAASAATTRPTTAP